MLRGDRFRNLRLQEGYTHQELAELLGTNIRNIARYEGQEADPSSDLITKIAAVFNVSADYLLGITDDPIPHLKVDNLSPKERQILLAMRRGEVVEAIRVLVSADDKTPV